MKKQDLSQERAEIIHWQDEKIVKLDVLRKAFTAGNSAAVSLPKELRGKWVRVILIDESMEKEQ